MRETQAIIERIRSVNDTHQQLHLAVDDSLSQLKPGQSLLARVADRWGPYLREHWWPVSVGKESLIVERPGNLRYEPGQTVDLLGIVGQPYRFRRTLRNVLLMAYETEPTPLIITIPVLLANKVSVTLLLLGKASSYGTAHLSPEVEVIKGDEELNWPNRVTTVGWADQVFAVVPQDDEMLRFGQIWKMFSELRAEIPANYLFGVFRPPLPCGVGACQACTIKLRQGSSMICEEGPSIDLTKVPLP